MRGVSVAVLVGLSGLVVACGADEGESGDGGPNADATIPDAGDDGFVGEDTGGSADVTIEPSDRARVYYTFEDQIWAVYAVDGAVPVNLTVERGAAGIGSRDRWVSASRNGDWLAFSSDRHEGGSEILMLAHVLLDGASMPVLAGGAEVYLEGIPAVTDDGLTVVFPAQGGPHERDIFATTFDGSAWSEPALLTGDSSYEYNNMPAMSHDGASVYFDCGDNPYPEDGANDACVVGVDGSGFARVVGPDTLPDARFDKVQFPHEGPDGLLFEASWPIDGDSPEIIWRLAPGADAPTPIGAAFPNSVSPCVFADGRFVILWLGREGNDEGKHELTLVDADGGLITVLTPGVDVADIGIGCGG
jgi:hypothetical protein